MLQKSIIGEDSSLIPKTGDKYEGKCPRLTICPISAMIQNVEADVNPISKEAKKVSFWEKTMVGSECANGNTDEKNMRNSSLARLSGCCYGSEKPGTLALLLHKLLLRNVESLVATKAPFNVRSTVSVECYNPKFTLLKINGLMELTNKRLTDKELGKLFLNCLQGIVISPVVEKDAWFNYAKLLCDTVNNWLLSLDPSKLDLSKEDINKYKLVIAYESNKHNLLVISEEYKNLLLRELLHVHTDQLIQHSEIQNKEEKKREIDGYFRSYDRGNKIALLKQETVTNINVEGVKDDYKEKITKGDDILVKETITDKLDRNIKSEITPCSVPISKCPFKSKALYLLKNDVSGQGKNSNG